MKTYSPAQVVEELAKALHRCIAKAHPDLKAVLADLEDKDAEAEASPDAVPATAEPVLEKKSETYTEGFSRRLKARLGQK
jgi:hypothetical protein